MPSILKQIAIAVALFTGIDLLITFQTTFLYPQETIELPSQTFGDLDAALQVPLPVDVDPDVQEKRITEPSPSLQPPSWQSIKSAQFDVTDDEKKVLESLSDDHNPPFQRYDDVVIVTKVLWPRDLSRLKATLCLVKASYNRFVNYDIVVFTTLPWNQKQLDDLAKIVAPAKLTVALDGPPLEDQLKAMTKEEIEFLEDRCAVNKTEGPITWQHHCTEERSRHKNNLGYSWQSEFRAFHIWKHAALAAYKYMMWIDADALVSKTWENDPMETMIKNNLTLMFDNIYGRTLWPELKTKQMKAYNRSICRIGLAEEGGHLLAKECEGEDDRIELWQIHGFFHITNMDFYRSERHYNFLRILVEDYRFSRKWDDQIAVMVPVLIEEPEKAWDLRSHNFTLRIAHHGLYDGKEINNYRNKKRWWENDIKGNWTAGVALCSSCF